MLSDESIQIDLLFCFLVCVLIAETVNQQNRKTNVISGFSHLESTDELEPRLSAESDSRNWFPSLELSFLPLFLRDESFELFVPPPSQLCRRPLPPIYTL